MYVGDEARSQGGSSIVQQPSEWTGAGGTSGDVLRDPGGTRGRPPGVSHPRVTHGRTDLHASIPTLDPRPHIRYFPGRTGCIWKTDPSLPTEINPCHESALSRTDPHIPNTKKFLLKLKSGLLRYVRKKDGTPQRIAASFVVLSSTSLLSPSPLTSLRPVRVQGIETLEPGP